MTKVHEQPKRARGAELRRIPQGTPVYATAPAGRGRHRWAVWACKTHVERRMDLDWFDDTMQRPDPLARGFAATDEEATAQALAAAPGAIRVTRYYATAGFLSCFDDREEAVRLGPEVAAFVQADAQTLESVKRCAATEARRAYERIRDAYREHIGDRSFDWQGYVSMQALRLLQAAGVLAAPRRVPREDVRARVAAELADVRACVEHAATEIACLRVLHVHADVFAPAGHARERIRWITAMAFAVPMDGSVRAAAADLLASTFHGCASTGQA